MNDALEHKAQEEAARAGECFSRLKAHLNNMLQMGYNVSFDYKSGASHDVINRTEAAPRAILAGLVRGFSFAKTTTVKSNES